MGVRRNHTSAGPTTRKLITKSVAGESLSKRPVRTPVCSREVPGDGRSPSRLERCSQRISLVCELSTAAITSAKAKVLTPRSYLALLSPKPYAYLLPGRREVGLR